MPEIKKADERLGNVFVQRGRDGETVDPHQTGQNRIQ